MNDIVLNPFYSRKRSRYFKEREVTDVDKSSSESEYDAEIDEDRELKIGLVWQIKHVNVQNMGDHQSISSERITATGIYEVQYFLTLELDDDAFYWNFHILSPYARHVKIVGKINVASAGISFPLETYTSQKEDKRRGFFCRKEDLEGRNNRYFVIGRMNVNLQASIYVQPIKRKGIKPPSVARLAYKLSETETDVVLVGENKEVKFHGWILTACSPVIETELRNEMFEEARHQRIVTNFPHRVIEIVKMFIYERKIDKCITINNGFDLLRFSDYYNIQSLHNYLQTYFSDRINENTVCKMANWAVKTNAKDLQESCICFLMKYVGKSAFISGYNNVHEDIVKEIGRRCIFSRTE